jgi:hypothetical protein
MTMRTKLTVTKCLVCVAAIILVLVVGGAGSAAAAEPWWQLNVTPAPTDIQPGQAKNDVQELIISASKGDVFLAEKQSLIEFFSGTRTFAEPPYAIIKHDASSEEMQKAIARLYAPAQVQVKEGQTSPSEPNTTRYVITLWTAPSNCCSQLGISQNHLKEKICRVKERRAPAQVKRPSSGSRKADPTRSCWWPPPIWAMPISRAAAPP